MPSLGTLKNILITNYSIASSVAETATNVFIETAQSVGVVQNGVLDISDGTINYETNIIEVSEQRDDIEVKEEKINIDITTESLSNNKDFGDPLTIPFGDERKAVLYMPLNSTKENALYVKSMISLLFKNIYGVDE